MNNHCRTLAYLTFHFDASMMKRHDFLSDGKPQAITTDVAVPRQVGFVKPLENIIQLLSGYSDPRIGYREEISFPEWVMRISICPPTGVNLMLLPSKFIHTWLSWSRSALILILYQPILNQCECLWPTIEARK